MPQQIHTDYKIPNEKINTHIEKEFKWHDMKDVPPNLTTYQVPREFDPPTGMTYGLLPSFSNFSFNKSVRAWDHIYKKNKPKLKETC